MVATRFYGCDEPDFLAVPSVVPEASDPRDLVAVFRPCFTAPVWSRVLVLVAGPFCVGKRTITQALRVMGLADQPGFRRYHEALSRARWDSREVARRLLMHLLAVFWPSGEVVIAIDDTIERRWGAKIKARGIYRDPVRSSRGMFVKTSGCVGCRWGHVADSLRGEAWALPFLTLLAPRPDGARRKARTEDPDRPCLGHFAGQTLVGGSLGRRGRLSSFAALELIAAVRDHVCLVTRLRLDANLSSRPRAPTGQRGGRR